MRSGALWIGTGAGVVAFLVLNFFLLPPRRTLELQPPILWLLLPMFAGASAAAAHWIERGRARRELARRIAVKDAVVAAMSHDLRTPLTTIKAMAHDLAADGDERAILIEEEAERLSVLVTNMLELSRLDNGAAALNVEPNEAEDLIGAALQRVAGASAGREVRVSLDAGEPLLFGRFDFTQTLRALVNLIENALKYSPAHQPVDVAVRREREWLSFSVLDRGTGVQESERHRIFEPFYRGLGLSIARSVAEAQGGSLVFAPREGGGSAFTMRVPAVDVIDESQRTS